MRPSALIANQPRDERLRHVQNFSVVEDNPIQFEVGT
jgi:hypothetical protein